MMSEFKRRLGRGVLTALLLSMALSLLACGSSEDGASAGEGVVVVGLTDAQGDFLSYTVDVLSLTLTRADGGVVETLPLSTRVDFAQYTDLTEFLTAASVPSGRYVKAEMRVDYSHADIQVEDANGAALAAGAIQDADGNPVGVLDLSVHLAGRNALFIAPGIPMHITLDFDLAASNRVEFTQPEEAVVTVEPLLLADVQLEAPKIHRLRGPLKRVDVDAGRLSLIIRPFRHVLAGIDERFGTLEVVTDESTIYDIDGQVYQGTDGLSALDAKPAFAATVVVGDLKFGPRRFVARQVYAGSSVPGGDLDVVSGTLMQRSGDSVLVKGATLIRADGRVVFNDAVSVELDASTMVRRQFSMDTPGIDDISVGQRVRIFGTITQDMPQDMIMSAGNGYAHMLITVLRGTQLASDPDTQILEMNLQAINLHPVAAFDFTGTGIDAANDADPGQYEIDTATLDLSGIANGAALKVGGFVRPFAQAPKDFQAHTVVDVSKVKGVMAVNWDPASTAAITLSDTSLSLDLTGVGAYHHLGRAGVRIDLLDQTSAPDISAADEAVFVIRQGEAAAVHTDFAGFSADLQARLDAGAPVRTVFARGSFDDGAVSLSAGLIVVRVE